MNDINLLPQEMEITVGQGVVKTLMLSCTFVLLIIICCCYVVENNLSKALLKRYLLKDKNNALTQQISILQTQSSNHSTLLNNEKVVVRLFHKRKQLARALLLFTRAIPNDIVLTKFTIDESELAFSGYIGQHRDSLKVMFDNLQDDALFKLLKLIPPDNQTDAFSARFAINPLSEKPNS